MLLTPGKTVMPENRILTNISGLTQVLELIVVLESYHWLEVIPRHVVLCLTTFYPRGFTTQETQPLQLIPALVDLSRL